MKERIENLLKKTSDIINDDEINSHFLNYICVLISGYLEKELENIIEEYKKSKHCKSHECKDTIGSMRKIQDEWGAQQIKDRREKLINQLFEF